MRCLVYMMRASRMGRKLFAFPFVGSLRAMRKELRNKSDQLDITLLSGSGQHGISITRFARTR